MPIPSPFVTGMSIALIMTFSLPVMGQKFSLGVKAGPSVTFGRFQDSDSRDNFSTRVKPGFTIGGLVQFPLKGNYFFLSEFAYSRKGKKVLFNDNTWTNNSTFTFIDLSMAIRKSYAFLLKPNVRSNFFVNVGPSIEYWLSGDGTIEATGPPAKFNIAFNQPPNGNFDTNFYTEANRWLFGINLGIGTDAPITPTHRIYTEIRFTLGQTNLGEKNSTSELGIIGFEDDLKMNLKTITLSAAYTFAFDLKESKMGKSTKDKVIKRKKKRR